MFKSFKSFKSGWNYLQKPKLPQAFLMYAYHQHQHRLNKGKICANITSMTFMSEIIVDRRTNVAIVHIPRSRA